MTWTEEEDFEYPPGVPIRVNAWRADLRAPGNPGGAAAAQA